jgi:hypothetical protein
MNIIVDICRPVRIYSFSTLCHTYDVLSGKLARLVSSRLCTETKLGLVFSFSPSLSLVAFSFSIFFIIIQALTNITMILFSIRHYITNRRRQLMNWRRRRRYIVFESIEGKNSLKTKLNWNEKKEIIYELVRRLSFFFNDNSN